MSFQAFGRRMGRLMPNGASGGSAIFGTLNSDDGRAAQEYRAGLRAVEMEVGWNWYEPQDGRFSDPTIPGSYAGQCRAKLRAFLAAGMKVVLSIGLQYPPAWLYTYRDSHYVNQDGIQAPAELNLTFNDTLRAKAEAYMARVSRDLGLNNMWAIRVGAGPESEVVLPEETAGGSSNSFWAFDANAQGRDDDRPATIAPNPYPGWKPGQTTYNGRHFSTGQVTQWVKWYFDGVMDGVNWQIDYYRQLGYIGYIQVPMPGLGVRPSELATAINGYLDGAGDAGQSLGRGAVWGQDITRIGATNRVVIDISSVGDASSSVRYASESLCRANDDTVSPNDPRILHWSSVRWIAYNARRVGLGLIGENPSKGDVTPANPYGLSLLLRAVQLMKSCGLQGLLWAFDSNLYDGTGVVTLADYSAIVAEFSR